MDYFASADARMTYIFNRTGGDAQKHLFPRFADDLLNSFLSEKKMFEYLSSIYKDPFKTANARQDYRNLIIKITKTFSEFYTRFLYLSG